jgi:16S rRNA (guanine1207-N2)-methyltransferase
MTSILYGRPPAVFDPPSGATQTSPLIPGSADLAEMAADSLDAATILAPPGVLERRYVLAKALKALKPGGRLDVMAPKLKGGARLGKELREFGLEPIESAKAHHRRCELMRPETVTGLDEAIQAGAPRIVPGLDAWSQPGVFGWDRIDGGTALLAANLPPLKGAGADLGCGFGALSIAALASPAVTSFDMIDLDRRAVDCARRNVEDARVRLHWADARTVDLTDLNFVVMNPPFHDGGAEDKALGQAFIRKAAAMLKKGGVLWMVANRHLPYEAELNTAFAKVRPVADKGGYKVFEAVK